MSKTLQNSPLENTKDNLSLITKEKPKSAIDLEREPELGLLMKLEDYSTEAERLAFCDGLGVSRAEYTRFKLKYTRVMDQYRKEKK
jgi:hypothetical protein